MNSPLARRLGAYARLIRLDRPIGTYLVLWPTLWALWVASGGRPGPTILPVFLAGVFLMRAAGCAINDYADRHVDAHVRRTRLRPLAAGEIAAGEALAIAALLALVAFALTVLFLNRLTALLALGGALLAAVYPFTKRVTHLPQFVLGVAFAWAVPMAFAAQTGAVPGQAWLWFLAVVLWAAAYDTIYAMVDREDDVRIGVKSTAILFGRHDRVAVAALHLATLGSLALAGQQAGLGAWYAAGLAAAALFMAYQLVLIRGRDRDACFRAFLNNNSVGFAIFAGILLHYVYR